MRRRLLRPTLTAGALLLAAGCSSYRYMRDSTAELERSRAEYVENNPGNRFNTDIGSGRVRKGMSRLQVRITWGDPDLVAVQVPGGETWSYEETEPSRGNSVYELRFDGELLSDIDIVRSELQLHNTEDRMRRARREEGTTRTDAGKKPTER